MSSSEMIISEVHVILFLTELINFTELVHVQLSNKGRKVFVSEVMWQDLFF